MEDKLTQEELHKLICYNSDTGVFIWRINRNQFVRKGDIAGYKDKDGYLTIRVNGVLYQAHRLAWLYTDGYFPENLIDHIDRNPSNNKRSNLREASHQCNARNSKIRSDNSTGIPGISIHNPSRKYCAKITVSQKQIYIGIYKNFDDAVKARWEAEVKYNFPNCNTTSPAYLYLKEKGLL